MPTYVYRCPNKHECTAIHGMREVVKVFCPVCGEVMHRRPQALAIKRSCFIEPSPAIANHLATLDEHRDQYREKYDK